MLVLAATPQFTIRTYSDLDWASDPDDRRSTSGSCLLFGHNLISWSSKKQALVIRFSTEVEYMTLAHTTSELLWSESLFAELHILYSDPTLFYDNLSDVMSSHNLVLHARTKHIELDIHSV